jgi:hypothetical protein
MLVRQCSETLNFIKRMSDGYKRYVERLSRHPDLIAAGKFIVIKGKVHPITCHEGTEEM